MYFVTFCTRQLWVFLSCAYMRCRCSEQVRLWAEIPSIGIDRVRVNLFNRRSDLEKKKSFFGTLWITTLLLVAHLLSKPTLPKYRSLLTRLVKFNLSCHAIALCLCYLLKMFSGKWSGFLKRYQQAFSECNSCESKLNVHVLFDIRTCGPRPIFAFSGNNRLLNVPLGFILESCTHLVYTEKDCAVDIARFDGSIFHSLPLTRTWVPYVWYWNGTVCSWTFRFGLLFLHSSASFQFILCLWHK